MFTQQMKRKLDDVQKRLETMYDLLRENRVSHPLIFVRFMSNVAEWPISDFYAAKCLILQI